MRGTVRAGGGVAGMVAGRANYQGGDLMEVQKTRRLVQWHTASITDFVSNIKSARAFCNARLYGIPNKIGRVLLDEYARRYNKPAEKNKSISYNPVRSANIYLRTATDAVRQYLDNCPFENLAILHNRDYLETHAADCAQRCEHLLMEYNDKDKAGNDYQTSIFVVYDRMAGVCKAAGVAPPMGNCETEIEAKEGAIIRMIRPEWWEKRFTRLVEQINEHVYVLAGFVRKGRQAYASNVCVNAWKQQQKANAEYLESMDLVDEESGERYNLADLVAASSASRDKRRVELMVRCRGLEDLADDMGYISYFVTWTAPSQYHPNSRKYNGSQANETHAYLCNQWAKARAKIKRDEIDWFGVRVAEPHADSCPHWHMLIFVRPEHKQAMQNILADYATEHDKYELVNAKGVLNIRPRFDIEEIDRSKGSATGYIAKYIAKNIDGANIGDDPDFETGNSSIDDSVARVAAWASRWRIRQFQFFGAAAVSVWRECRRLKSELENKAFEAIRKAADSAKWAEFTKLVKENPVKLSYEKSKNEFNEITRKVIGILFNGEQVNTREKSYRLERRQAQEKNGGSRFTWSPVSNCTVQPGSGGQDRNNLTGRLTKAVCNAGLDPYFVPILARGGRVVDDNRLFVVLDNEFRVFE